MPHPEVTPACAKWEPELDQRYCIVNYKCSGGGAAAPAAEAAHGAEAEHHEEPARELKCDVLNPWEHADVHPESDPSCEHGEPGWSKTANCQCDYLVKERDASTGCVKRYHAKCTSGSAAAPAVAAQAEAPAAHEAAPAPAPAAPAAPAEAAPAPAAPAAPAPAPAAGGYLRN